MEKIYILFLAFILAGCTDANPIGHDGTDAEYTIDPIVEDIVKDVASDQHNYIGRTVRIKGIVKRTAKDFKPLPGARKDQITIQTGVSDVEFFILGDKVYCPRFFGPLPKTRLWYNTILLKGVIPWPNEGNVLPSEIRTTV